MSTVDDAAYAAESRLPTILGVLTTFFFLALIVVCMRIYVRVFITRSFGADDVLICLALLCQLAGWIVILIQSKHGLGHHQSTISQKEMIIFNHASFWGNVIEIAVGTMFLKLGIATNLLRLCRNRWYTIALWVIIGVVIAYEVTAFIFFFLNCKPVSGNWDTTIKAECAPIHTIVVFGLLNTSGNILTDVALAIIPIPIIWGLNMKMATRLYLVAILSLGYLAVAMDIVKTYYQQTYTILTDETHTFSLIFFGFLYGCLGLIASSVPMLKPLASKALGLDSTHDRSYYAYGTDNGPPGGRARTRAGASGSNARSRARGGNTANMSIAEASGYELDERDSDPGGSGSLNSERKSEGLTSVSAYHHNTGSQDNILYYSQAIGGSGSGSGTTTNISNGGMAGSSIGINGSRTQHSQLESNFRGIKKTTEVSVN
ncbi:integral membrane protein [Ophiostoma piceae UAMH 11346]|uniref:Integral membrane protein n=1 Tax=Ophiostoma piceae (strain UAMH 11346) TaxID=1262450 RepID=S3D9T9_OPHP1|nr:integral membrane protein [Ophiostoma piceae UAMH 11346]